MDQYYICDGRFIFLMKLSEKNFLNVEFLRSNFPSNVSISNLPPVRHRKKKAMQNSLFSNHLFSKYTKANLDKNFIRFLLPLSNGKLNTFLLVEN